MTKNENNKLPVKCDRCGFPMDAQTSIEMGDPIKGNFDRWTAYRCPNERCLSGFVEHIGHFTGEK